MKPTREPFRVEHRDGLRLITPNGFAAADDAVWNEGNLWHRSRIETADGRTVSQGFGKFFNLGCGPAGLAIGADDVVAACERDDAVATLKVDGSLLIRSVHAGLVIMRSRGSWAAEHLPNGDEVDGFRRKYAALSDPSYLTGVSLLFEWVSPRNVIVLRYPEPALTLVGGVCHDPLRYLTLTATTDATLTSSASNSRGQTAPSSASTG